MRIEMKPRYRLYRRRNGMFYSEDTQTHKQQSLKTRVEDDAERLVHAKNEACALPGINRQIGQIYLRACDPAAATRTWQFVMEQLVATKTGAATRRRWGYAIRNKAYDTFRHLPVLETPVPPKNAVWPETVASIGLCTNRSMVGDAFDVRRRFSSP